MKHNHKLQNTKETSSKHEKVNENNQSEVPSILLVLALPKITQQKIF